MSGSKVQEAFVSARLVVLVVAMLALCLIGYHRLELYIKNIIIHESTMKDIDESWFDMSICFGPKYSLETINIYLKANELRQHYPDTWKEILRGTDARYLHAHGAMAITSIEQYRDFFLHKFNWSVDSMYDVGLAVNIESLGIGWYKHEFPANATKFNADFNFLSFKYSWCFNYTYKHMFAGHESVDGVKESRSLEDPYHRIGVHNHQYDWYFILNSISEYMDIFVYPKGHEFEYPLIEDHVPFRIDMVDWQRLRTSARKVVRQNRPKFNCIDQELLGNNETYSYNLCLTWCLRRTLLNHVKCTIPELDHYIYNFTHVLGSYMATPPQKRELFRSGVYFNSDSAWPWMKGYLNLQPCTSAQSFHETFTTFEWTYFPRGEKFAMNSSCETECLPECTEYHVLIATEGTELHPAAEKLHGVTIYYSARVEEIREKWKYTFAQLLIDLSGVMSFLLGLSLIAIHEWCFILTRWLLQRRSSMAEAPPPELSYLRDDMRYDDFHEYPDDYYDYREGGQHSRTFYPEDYDDYYDEYGGEYEYDEYDDQYDHADDTGEYGDERFDYAGDEKVINAAHSGFVHGHPSPMANKERHAKSSHLIP